MNRRKSFHALAAFGAAALPAPAAGGAIQLHVDLEVDKAKEKDLLANFRKTFRPTISKQDGFVDVKLLKFNQSMHGDPPKSMTYRLVISFQTEAQRLKWVASGDHQAAWPTIERNLTGAKLAAWLYDIV
jgi:heme-degrading monooxygenase HmoA